MQKEADREWMAKVSLFKHDITYLQAITGVRVDAKLITDKKSGNAIKPALKLVIEKRTPEKELKAVREAHVVGKQNACKTLRVPFVENLPELTDWEKLLVRISPRKVFWKKYLKLEKDHELGLSPIITAYPQAIWATFDIVIKKRPNPQSAPVVDKKK